MWQTGIWRAEQLKGGAAAAGQRSISLGLLAIGEPASAEEIRLFEIVQLSMLTGQGIYRTTYRNRMPDVNQRVSKWLREARREWSRLQVADWAASDCLTASEWAAELSGEWSDISFQASDLLLEVHEWRSGNEAYYVQPDGTALQYVKHPFVISLRQKARRWYPWNRRLQDRALSHLPPFQKASGDEFAYAGKQWKRRVLSVVHPEARQLAAADQRFRIGQHSLFEVADEAVQVLRTMNVLNRGYMDQATLERGVRAIHGSLVNGGLWVVGRTTEERTDRVNQVTLYERNADGFTLLDRLNGGSEMEPIVEGWRG